MALERQAGNFAVAYKNANSEGKPARARDLLKERIKQGIDSDVCYPGAWTTESFSCIQGNIYGCLAEFNPLIPYAQTAVDVHKNNGEFYLTPDVLLNARPATAVILEIAKQDNSRGFWLSSIGHGGRSVFSCGIRGLYSDDGSLFRVRGKESAEGPQKISLNKMTSSAD